MIAGCSDLIVATRNSSLGMAGPAMIAGGGLGDVSPEDVGPVEVQSPNGVLDLVVEDEAEAVEATRRLLGYFRGPVEEFSAPDQAPLRDAVPESSRRAYDVTPIVRRSPTRTPSRCSGRPSRPSCSPRWSGSRAGPRE